MKKTVLVTGANGNLGQAVTRKFLSEGYQVKGFIAPGANPDFLRDENLEVHEVDLMDEEKTFKTIENAGDFDGAVLTVGGFGMGSFENTSIKDVDKMYKLNFQTAYNSSRAAFKTLKAKGKKGQIVLIGARPALDVKAASGVVAYAFSKRLVQYLSDIINEESDKTGITSSVIMPSLIDTPPNRKAMPDADFEKWVKPETIANNIHHLFTESGKALRETVLKVYNKS
ncbi:MAG TPA: SDR family NAD(P)-dependent oxidoreductase [Bacteroidales bacterium]|nr:SDR family NAD(P)-dependent oxidoreductase [Bacteroidales bacterium]